MSNPFEILDLSARETTEQSNNPSDNSKKKKKKQKQNKNVNQLRETNLPKNSDKANSQEQTNKSPLQEYRANFEEKAALLEKLPENLQKEKEQFSTLSKNLKEKRKLQTDLRNGVLEKENKLQQLTDSLAVDSSPQEEEHVDLAQLEKFQKEERSLVESREKIEEKMSEPTRVQKEVDDLKKKNTIEAFRAKKAKIYDMTEKQILERLELCAKNIEDCEQKKEQYLIAKRMADMLGATFTNSATQMAIQGIKQNLKDANDVIGSIHREANQFLQSAYDQWAENLRASEQYKDLKRQHREINEKIDGLRSQISALTGESGEDDKLLTFDAQVEPSGNSAREKAEQEIKILEKQINRDKNTIDILGYEIAKLENEDSLKEHHIEIIKKRMDLLKKQEDIHKQLLNILDKYDQLQKQKERNKDWSTQNKDLIDQFEKAIEEYLAAGRKLHEGQHQLLDLQYSLKENKLALDSLVNNSTEMPKLLALVEKLNTERNKKIAYAPIIMDAINLLKEIKNQWGNKDDLKNTVQSLFAKETVGYKNGSYIWEQLLRGMANRNKDKDMIQDFWKRALNFSQLNQNITINCEQQFQETIRNTSPAQMDKKAVRESQEEASNQMREVGTEFGKLCKKLLQEIYDAYLDPFERYKFYIDLNSTGGSNITTDELNERLKAIYKEQNDISNDINRLLLVADVKKETKNRGLKNFKIRSMK